MVIDLTQNKLSQQMNLWLVSRSVLGLLCEDLGLHYEELMNWNSAQIQVFLTTLLTGRSSCAT